MLCETFETRESEKYGDIDFLRLQLNDDGKSALILGYRIVLTAAEFAILDTLMKGGEQVLKSDLETKCGISNSSIPVHISHINKKAFKITNRRLIVKEPNGVYHISDTL